jgi:hypothetical protein
VLSKTLQKRKCPWTISNREFRASCWRLHEVCGSPPAHQQALARGARSVRSGGCDLRLKGRVTGWQLCVAFERRHHRLTCLVCRFGASQVHFRAMGTGSAPAPFPVINRKPTLGATLRNFTFGDLCSMFGCTVAGGVWGFAAGAHAHALRSSAPCTTWLVAFALNLPASLVPPSSRSLPAARSFAYRRQAPSAAWQHQPRYDCVLCCLCLLLPGLVAPAHRPAAERVRVLLRRRPLRESELDNALHLS